MMKFAGGTLFQRDQMDAAEFLKQADLYEAVDANILDRVYKMLLVGAVNHPLTIVRAREIMNWSESREYKDILMGRYPRHAAPGFAENHTWNKSGNAGAGGKSTDTKKPSSSSSTPSPASNGNALIRCPHCNREQPNRRFCSLCGGAIA